LPPAIPTIRFEQVFMLPCDPLKIRHSEKTSRHAHQESTIDVPVSRNPGCSSHAGREAKTMILVIEDNKNDAKIIKYALTRNGKEGFDVSVALCLSQGIEMLSPVNKPSLVLLDLDLPDSNGIDTVVRLHQACPTVPIIVLTGADNQSLALEALRAGADDYLSKADIADGVLSRTIRYATERRSVRVQLVRAKQLEVLGQITGAAMHEFNNLAQVVAGNIDLLLDPVGESESPASRLERIKTALRKMAALTEGLSHFIRETSGTELPRVDLKTALANIQVMLDQS
jgi:sigma-B regulation protein RsbU (phosphoserine phosphatase)